MPKFNSGTYTNASQNKNKRIRVCAGPQRGQYVDRLILEAKLRRPIRDGYTVEHLDGNDLNIDPNNLEEVTDRQNTSMMHTRRSWSKAC